MRRIALCFIVAMLLGLGGRGLQAETSAVLSSTPEAQAAFNRFLHGPYRPMAAGRVPRTTLVQGIYALADPSHQWAAIYIDADVTIMKNGAGPWLDIASGHPLPSPQVAALRARMASQLDLSAAIVERFGGGSRKVILLSDYDCPVCRNLEHQLQLRRPDATVFIIPGTLDPRSPAHLANLEALWCSPDPSSLWRSVMLNNARLPGVPPGCARDVSPSDDLLLLFNIQRVPAVIQPDGTAASAMSAAF